MEKPPSKLNGHEKENIITDPFDDFKESLDFEEPGNEYTKRRELVADKISLEGAVQRAIKKTNDSYLKILGNSLLTNKKFTEGKYAYIAKQGKQDEFVKATGGPGHGFFEGFESIDDPRMIIHEAIHVYTNPVLYPNESTLNPVKLELNAKIKEYFDIATKNASEEYHYGLTNEFEFLSELSNKNFIRFLESIPYENESLDEISLEALGSVIDSLKNPFMKDFEIVSDLQVTEDGQDYFYTLKFNNDAEQNQYFKTEQEAEIFHKKKSGEYDTNNLAIATINQFFKLVRVVENAKNS